MVSLEMQVFVKAVNDSLIPRWIERLNSLGMQCEIHPGFSFESHSGFLPFKISLQSSPHEQLVGTPYLTGFEISVQDFDLSKEVAAIQPKPTFLERITGKGSRPEFFASQDIDPLLASCKKVIHCVWGSADTLELRMATLSAAILSELTGGVFSYPADNLWYTESGEVEKVLQEAEAYEASLTPKQLRLHRFEQWR